MSPYLKGGGGSSTKMVNRMQYFATRPGVEVLREAPDDLPATKKQQTYIRRLLRSFPEAKELLEYEDYLKKPTQLSASEFIQQARENFVDPMSGRTIWTTCPTAPVWNCGESTVSGPAGAR